MRQTPLYTALVAAQVSVGIHVALVPAHLNEKVAVGVLFVLLASVLVGAMMLLYSISTRRAGFVLGSLACATQVVAFVLSRTTGLPGGVHEPWASDAEGYVALAATAMSFVFIGASVTALRSTDGTAGGRHRSFGRDGSAAVAVARASNRPVVELVPSQAVTDRAPTGWSVAAAAASEASDRIARRERAVRARRDGS